MATYITKTGKLIDESGKVVGTAPIGSTGQYTEGIAPNPSYVAPTNPPPTVSTPTVDRTAGIGKLGTSQEELAKTSSEETAKKARQDAELYASQQRQARIDAINTTFAPRIARQEEEGKAQLSRVDALNFKRGVTGSGIDTTKTGEQKGLNEKAMQALEDEKSLLVNDAFQQADKLATERAALLTEQAKGAAQANVDLYKAQSEKAISTIKAFGAAGVSLQEIEKADPDTIKTLREVSGLSDAEISNLLMTSAPVGTYQWDQAYKTGNKYVVPKLMNGKITLETIEAPKGVNFDSGDWKFNKDVGFYNEKTQQIKPIAGTGGGSGVGGLNSFPADIQAAAQSILDGKSKLNEYPSAKRLQINQAMSKVYTAEGGNELAQGAYDSILTLENHPGFKGAIGAKGLSSFFGLKEKPLEGSQAASFIQELDKLKANIKLVNIKYLKGTGALSDAEGKTLEDAGTSLSTALNEESFTAELARVKKVLEKANKFSQENSVALNSSIPADILSKIKADHPELTEAEIIEQYNNQ